MNDPDVAYVLQNRPTTAGVHWIVLGLPFRMNIVEAKAQLAPAANVKMADDEKIKTGMLFWDKGSTGVANIVPPEAAAQMFATGDFQGAWWRPQIALLGTNGIVNSVGFYAVTTEDPGIPGGLVDVAETYFDTQGNILKEIDSQGNEWTPTTSGGSLGWVLPVALAVLRIVAWVLAVTGVLAWFAGGKNSANGETGWRGAVRRISEGIKAIPKFVKTAYQQGKEAVSNLATFAKWGLIGLISYKVLDLLT